MQDFRKLEVWNLSKTLSINIYKISSSFPKSELFGITAQIRRCSTSISLNIAEGSRRNTNKDFSHFLNIAIGSLNELGTLIEISHELKYISSSEYESLFEDIDKIKRKVITFRRYLV